MTNKMSGLQHLTQKQGLKTMFWFCSGPIEYQFLQMVLVVLTPILLVVA